MNNTGIEVESGSCCAQGFETADAAGLAERIARQVESAGESLQVDGPVWCARGSGVRLGAFVHLSAGCAIWDMGQVRIGDCAIIGVGVKIRAEAERPVWIGDRVWIGEGAEIEPGAVIGDDAIVCGGTRVEGEVAARTVSAGNPRRLLRSVR